METKQQVCVVLSITLGVLSLLWAPAGMLALISGVIGLNMVE